MRETHGGNVYDYQQIKYDFSANVNPLGMPAGVIEVIKKEAENLSKYPDILGRDLREQIAIHEGVTSSNVVLGNGAGELIYALCNALRPERCLVLAPSFSEYEAASRVFGCRLSRMNLKEKNNFNLTRHEMSDLFDWIRNTSGKRILFFCNPNNPTGVIVQKQHLLRIADICQQEGVYFCVDECFLPFLEDEKQHTVKTEVLAYPHLVVLRAFTKFYGMAGLRLGYALTSDSFLLERFRQVLPPWNTSMIAQLAGIEALKNREYENATRQLVAREREYLFCELENGLVDKVFPSGTNYLLFRAEEDLKETLLKDSILIRDCSNYINLEKGYYRIAVKKHEENVALIEALKKRF